MEESGKKASPRTEGGVGKLIIEKPDMMKLLLLLELNSPQPRAESGFISSPG